MPKHKETGINGELIAENFLLTKSYSILHRNWRYGKKEVDIIAKHNDTLVFIEVKTRSSFLFGFPEDAVDVRKQGYLKIAAEAYGDANPDFGSIRFDVISILLEKGHPKEIKHIEDAFF